MFCDGGWQRYVGLTICGFVFILLGGNQICFTVLDGRPILQSGQQNKSLIGYLGFLESHVLMKTAKIIRVRPIIDAIFFFHYQAIIFGIN